MRGGDILGIFVGLLYEDCDNDPMQIQWSVWFSNYGGSSCVLEFKLDKEYVTA